MTAIINRTPTGRLISLHAELRYLNARYGAGKFELKGLKYDSEAKVNPLMFFPLVVDHPSIGKYDPYLDNPLSPAKFHLTQSIQYDTQKSKSGSECLNALEALGWIERLGDQSRLTEKGLVIAKLKYEDAKMYELMRRSVLGYGVFVGFLYKCLLKSNSDGELNKNNVEIGYKDAHESIRLSGKNIPISTGSQKDTIVRTRSTLFAWAISTGFALPTNHDVPKNKLNWHVETLGEITNKHWGWSKLKLFIDKSLFDGSHFVERPLNYQWMTKSTRALRERGQQDIREASLQQETKVKNRRYAIVYCLALCAMRSTALNYDKFVEQLLKYPDLFVVNKNDFERVMQIEKDIAVISGIPFTDRDNILKPLNKINIEYLTKGAPREVIETIDSIYLKIR